MDFKPLIDKKDEAAKYMIDEITHICKDMDTRSPGTKGEKEACEYMAKVLKRIAAANVRTLNRLKKTPAHSSAGYTLRLPRSFGNRALLCGTDYFAYSHCCRSCNSIFTVRPLQKMR